MNKQDLVNKVSGKVEMSKKDSEKVVNAVFEVIAEALQSGDKVQIVGHGTYEVRERAAKKGLNPKKLEELRKQGVDEETAKAQSAIDIPESKVPFWKPAGKLKEAIK